MPSQDLTDWLGNSEECHDQIVAFPANALSATLNHDTQYVDGSSLPPLWHWLYFLPIYRLDQANYDGHAAHARSCNHYYTCIHVFYTLYTTEVIHVWC